MTIESGIIFGNFETLSSSPGPYGSSDEAKEYPVQNYEKKRIVRPGEDVVVVIVRFPSRRLASGDVCRIRDRRHIVGCVRWAACAPGARSFPHESGLRALSVLLMAACCILGALRDGSHEPAVDCKARHGRFREKERLFGFGPKRCPYSGRFLPGCPADAANGLFYGIPLRRIRSDFSEPSGERRPWHAKDGCSGFPLLSFVVFSVRL